MSETEQIIAKIILEIPNLTYITGTDVNDRVCAIYRTEDEIAKRIAKVLAPMVEFK
jgi:hypothetical protein